MRCGPDLHVLFIEDSKADVELITRALRKAGFQIHGEVVQSREEFTKALDEPTYDIVLADYNLPEWSGMEGLEILRQRGVDIPFILVTGTAGEGTAVDCIKKGAADYILKSSLKRLPVAVSRALEDRRQQAEKQQALAALEASEREYRRLFESANDAILIFEPQSETILEANRRACETYGVTRERLVGSSLKALTRDVSRGEQQIRELERQGTYTNFETTHLGAGGTPIEMLVNSSIIEYQGRKAVLSINRDVTDWKRAEEERKQLLGDLRQRVKEQTALHRAARLLNAVPTDTTELLSELVSILPAGLRHPEIAAARAVLGDLEISSAGFRQTQWQLTESFLTSEGTPGLVQVVYLAEPPEYDGAFLAEESSLLRSTAEMLKSHVVRRRAEDALRESQQQLQLAIQASHIGLWDYCIETGAVYFSPEWKAQIGYRDDEIGNRYEEWESRLHPDDHDRAIATDNAYLENPWPDFEKESRLRHKDGSYRWVLARASLLRDQNGKPWRLLGAQLDITERKRAEEALRASEERYRSLVENAAYGIYRATADGKLLDANPAFVEMLGYSSRAELLARGMAADVYRCVEDRARLIERFRATGRVEAAEVAFRRRDGTLVSVQLGGRIIHAGQDGTDVFEMIAENITERKALELQLRQAQKMEAVGRLAGGVAHDFNNLLTIIHGYSELLLEEVALDSKLRHAATEIKQAAGRAASLTSQLLAFSRRQTLQPQVLDLNVLVTNLEKMLRRLIGEDIELVIARSPDIGRVKADPGQMEQVLLNLAVNARDAMPQGGRLVIETTNAQLDETYASGHQSVEPGPYVMVTVTDTGCGMDAEVKSHIFEPFFTTKEQGKGTGLGLATVYGIVKQSGGTIWVYSEPDQGTTFKIYLPRVMANAQPVEIATKPIPPGGSETILLVEDETKLRELTGEILRRKGYTVLEASDGDEAIRISAQYGKPIHLLMTDVVMPRMNGRELAERLTSSYPHLKVLFVSGYTDDTIVRTKALESGMAFLQKPFSSDALARKLREVLASESMV